MTLEEYRGLVWDLQERLAAVPDSATKLGNALDALLEELELTLASFAAKDSVADKSIRKRTKTYAQEYYACRLLEIIESLTPEQQTAAGLAPIKRKLSANLSYSTAGQEPFKNPLPSLLFFSQSYHAQNFSGKAQRDGVSARSLDQVASDIREGNPQAVNLYLKCYFAQTEGSLRLYAYNNRTLVAFSKAGQRPSRVPPIVPTQDMLNRVYRHTLTDPERITDEDTGTVTQSVYKP